MPSFIICIFFLLSDVVSVLTFVLHLLSLLSFLFSDDVNSTTLVHRCLAILNVKPPEKQEEKNRIVHLVLVCPLRGAGFGRDVSGTFIIIVISSVS